MVLIFLSESVVKHTLKIFERFILPPVVISPKLLFAGC